MRIKREDTCDWVNIHEKGQNILMVLYFIPAQNLYSTVIMAFVFLSTNGLYSHSLTTHETYVLIKVQVDLRSVFISFLLHEYSHIGN